MKQLIRLAAQSPAVRLGDRGLFLVGSGNNGTVLRRVIECGPNTQFVFPNYRIRSLRISHRSLRERISSTPSPSMSPVLTCQLKVHPLVFVWKGNSAI